MSYSSGQLVVHRFFFSRRRPPPKSLLGWKNRVDGDTCYPTKILRNVMPFLFGCLLFRSHVIRAALLRCWPLFTAGLVQEELLRAPQQSITVAVRPEGRGGDCMKEVDGGLSHSQGMTHGHGLIEQFAVRFFAVCFCCLVRYAGCTG